MKYILTVLFVVLIFPSMLFAQTATPAPDTTINVGQLLAPWLEGLIGGVALLITAIVGWAAALFQRKTGIEIEARHREALQTALTNAAGRLLQRAGDKLETKTLNVQNPLIKDAIVYVSKAAPDAIEKFGLGFDDIAEKILAKVGVVTAPTTEPK